MWGPEEIPYYPAPQSWHRCIVGGMWVQRKFLTQHPKAVANRPIKMLLNFARHVSIGTCCQVLTHTPAAHALCSAGVYCGGCGPRIRARRDADDERLDALAHYLRNVRLF